MPSAMSQVLTQYNGSVSNLYVPHKSSWEHVSTEYNSFGNLSRMQLRGKDGLISIVSNTIPMLTSPPLPLNCKLKPISNVYANILQTQKISHINSVHLYIDGGCKPTATTHPMSWSVAAVASDSVDTLSLIGVSGGVINSSWNLFNVHNQASSFSAEVYANILALLWIHNFIKDPSAYTNLHVNSSIKFTIIYDNAPAAISVFAPTKDGNEYNLVNLARAIYIYVNRCTYNQIDYHHVKSHSLHPLNELADDLCTHYLQVQTSPIIPIPSLELNTTNIKSMHVYLSLTIPSTHNALNYSDLFDEYTYHVPDNIVSSNIDRVHESSPNEFTPDFVRCIQYNTLSLKEDSDLFLTLLNKHKIAIAMCQETRTKQSGVKCHDGFIVVHSPADHGSYGCEIWINMHIPFWEI